MVAGWHRWPGFPARRRAVAALLCLLATGVAASAERRVALVIGNAAYETLSPLVNPIADARRMAALLAARGFEVMDCGEADRGCTDLDRSAMLDAIEDFGDMAQGADVALFFYAGHGMQSAEGNVIAPVNMELTCDMLESRRATMLDDVLEEMAGATEKIVILDACRNDPFRTQQCAARGARPLSFGSFGVPDSASRFLLMSSTQNGQLAQDGAPGGHSPFAESLFHVMENAASEKFDQMLDKVTKRVIERTSAANFTQIPEILIRGGAPDACLSQEGCASALDGVALQRQVETLRAENRRNQEFEGIVVALLENAGYADPSSLSEGERRRIFGAIMEATRALASSPDGQAQLALAALKQGDDAPAEALLRDAAFRAPPSAPEAGNAERAKALRHLAAFKRLTDTAEAARLYGEAAGLDPDHLQGWIDLAELSLAAGDRAAALRAYGEARRLVESGAGTAEQAVWTIEGNADMAWSDGDRQTALALYRRANDYARQAALAMPGLTGLRRGIIVTHYNIGHLLMEDGRLDEALEAFRTGLAESEALAREEPENPVWQYDIGRGHERVGRALDASGDREGALAAFRRKHAIMSAVAARHPGNPEWQRDLSLADEFLGDMAVAAGDHAAAAARYRASLDRMIPVRDADPGNAGFQRFTAVTHLKAGDALAASGDRAAATENFQAAATISSRLVAIDDENAEWRWDLFRAYQRLASTEPPGTEFHRKALEVIEGMERDGLLSDERRRWIGITRERVAAAQ